MEDLARLTRGGGELPPAYLQWAFQAVELKGFWENNYLSTDTRIPVTITQTNSARAMATNGLTGHNWEDFASATYRNLDSVGRVTYHDPFSDAEKSFQAPSGGPGYYRVPTLIGIWATAPFFHNNALGEFNNDPSVAGRLKAFDDGITRLLWPEKRNAPTNHVIWAVNNDAKVNDPVLVPNATAEQIEADGGWIWRSSEESWFSLRPFEVPVLIEGLTGFTPFWLAILPWLPSLGFLLLSVAVFFNGAIYGSVTKLGTSAPWLTWLFSPFRWLLAVTALVLALVSVYYIFVYWSIIEVFDVATGKSIPWLRFQVLMVPIVLFGSIILLLSLPMLQKWPARRWMTYAFAGASLLLAILFAISIGRLVAGYGTGDIKIGPIPKGVPVNILANMDPDAPWTTRWAATRALITFFLDYDNAKKKGAPLPGKKEFEESVAPALFKASKCPDFVMDHGHDYEFTRQFTDKEKKDLIELLKSF